jgi:hypothetical protein
LRRWHVVYAVVIGVAAVVTALLALHWHALWWIAIVIVVIGAIGYAAGFAAQEGETRIDPEE